MRVRIPSRQPRTSSSTAARLEVIDLSVKGVRYGQLVPTTTGKMVI